MSDGVHREKAKDEEVTPEQVALMQTRDLSYVVHKRTAEAKKVERLRASLHLLEQDDDQGKKKNKHLFFVDSEEEKRNFDAAKRLNTHPALLNRTFNRPKMEDLEKLSSSMSVDREEVAKRGRKAYKELKQRMERERQLGVVQAKMEVRRHMQNKTGSAPAAVVREETKESAAVLRWPMERKK